MSLGITEDLLLLVTESENMHRGKLEAPQFHGTAELLSSLKAELHLLRQRCLRASGSYKVAVVGLGNVGKSTLINAILGQRVAPVSNAPCTANIVEFQYGEEFCLAAEAQGRLMPQHWTFTNVPQLHEQLCTMVAHEGGSEREWSRLEVSLPADILAEGLVLADTPGFGAAGDVGKQDDTVIANFLRRDVAQIFWVVMADQGIGRSELAFYQRYLVDRCDDLIVTNAEDWELQDQQRWKQRFAPKLRPFVQIHFVKGKQARRARESQDVLGWEQSGLADLCSRIQALHHTEGRIETVSHALGVLAGVAKRRLRALLPMLPPFCPITSARLCRKYEDESVMRPWIEVLNLSRTR